MSPGMQAAGIPMLILDILESQAERRFTDLSIWAEVQRRQPHATIAAVRRALWRLWHMGLITRDYEPKLDQWHQRRRCNWQHRKEIHV